MNTAAEEMISYTREDEISQFDVYKTLVAKEWLTHGRFVTFCLAFWILAFWILLLQPAGLIVVFGAVYALWAGAAFGGTESTEQTEEFLLSLPPTRSQRYLARLLLGGGSVLFFAMVNRFAIRWNLPQTVWGLFVESGFTEPFKIEGLRTVMAMGIDILIPVSVFAFSFPLASVAHVRSPKGYARALGALSAATLLLTSCWAEYVMWETLNGYLTIPVLVIASVGALIGGHSVYCRKEAIDDPEGSQSPWTQLLLTMIAILLVALIMGVVFDLARRLQ